MTSSSDSNEYPNSLVFNLNSKFKDDFGKCKYVSENVIIGGVLLSQALRLSTIGAGGLHDRVRNGIGFFHSAMTATNFL